MCYLRFEHWYRCNYQYRNRYLDYLEKGERYPCADMWMELTVACTDDMIDYLLELGYYREANKYHPKNHMNIDVRTIPSHFDDPDHSTDGRSYTY